jgi:hypothetical protein
MRKAKEQALLQRLVPNPPACNRPLTAFPEKGLPLTSSIRQITMASFPGRLDER